MIRAGIDHAGPDARARLGRSDKARPRKTLASTMPGPLNEKHLFGTNERLESVLELNCASAAQLRSSGPDGCRRDLRHPGRRGSAPRAEREYVQKAEVSFANEL